MVVAGRTYMLTRKCIGDRLYLSPTKDREVEQIYLYCLVLAALELGIQIHAFCAMGNHLLCAAAHKRCYAELGVMRSWRLDTAPVADLAGRRCA